ncbi:MAG: DMT family transporter [Acidimicrobiaceae bacterium]|nr:DMT family transporter [Acidimicrobiaceae bacterium]
MTLADRRQARSLPALVLLLLVALVWGATFSLTKDALVHTSAESFLFLRFALATLAMAPMIRFANPSRARLPTKNELVAGGVLGLLMWAGYELQTVGLNSISASLSGLLTGLSVVMVPYISLLFHRKVRTNAIVATFLALAGTALISGFGRINFGIGAWLTIGCAISFALQISVTDTVISRCNSVRLVFVELGVVSILSLISLLFSSRGSSGMVMSQLADIRFSIVATGVVVNALAATTFAFLAQAFAQRRLPPTEVGVVLALEPGFAVVVATFLGAPITIAEALGGVLIVIGVAWAAI